MIDSYIPLTLTRCGSDTPWPIWFLALQRYSPSFPSWTPLIIKEFSVINTLLSLTGLSWKNGRYAFFTSTQKYGIFSFDHPGPLLLLLQARVWKIESFSYINIFHAFSTRRILSYLKMNHNSIIIDVSQIVCNKNVLQHLNLHFCIPKYISWDLKGGCIWM